MRISGAVLAAGMSTRMGQNKLLLPYKGHTIIEEVLFQVSRAELDEIMVIMGYENRQVENAIYAKFGDRFRVIYNREFRKGRAESIKRAVENVSEDAGALLFMVGDKPTVETDLINRAILKFKETSPPILYVLTPRGRGHPVIFGKKLFGELMKLEGDIGGHDLITKYEDDLFELEDRHIQKDIDTTDDYESLPG